MPIAHCLSPQGGRGLVYKPYWRHGWGRSLSLSKEPPNHPSLPLIGRDFTISMRIAITRCSRRPALDGEPETAEYAGPILRVWGYDVLTAAYGRAGSSGPSPHPNLTRCRILVRRRYLGENADPSVIGFLHPCQDAAPGILSCYSGARLRVLCYLNATRHPLAGPGQEVRAQWLPALLE